jgi:prepilin-type N-terminal cleavage/methylation domain-containing protein
MVKIKIRKNSRVRQKGVTLIEVVVCTAIFAVLSISVYGVFTSIINGIIYYREKTTVSSLADQYLETMRNMPYSQIGTIEGNPHGSLADLPNPINLTISGTAYQIYYAVNYIDDPADGTIMAGTDPAPNDYKQVKLYVKNVRTGETSSFLTNAVPKGLEGLANGGALSIEVFNAVGQPVPGAKINIKNTTLVPNINLTRTADANGKWIEVGLPDSANSYNIVVSKTGYSTDQTYPITPQDPNPAKPDATISNGQVTQISFSIDQLSSLVFNTLNQTCSPIAGVGLEVRGSKLIGTPSVLKFDNLYTSNSNGQVSLNNLEWDSYTPALTGSAYMIYGSSPIQQVTILPGISQNFNLILGPKTTNSLLAIVKDASTGNPIEGAEVDLQTSVPPASYTITASANANGTITPSGAVLVNSGANKTFNIAPNSGYIIQNVSVDGAYVGAVSSYTFSNVTSDHAIEASFVPSVSWLSGWSYRKKITISNANIGSDLTNFPALVKITADSNMSQALATGYDIRFADSTGNTLLSYERESWSGGNGSAVTANFWVKVPAISHAAATTIYIYYGNSSAGEGQSAAGVWDSNYLGVWHMADNASNKTVVDSTGGDNGTAKANTSTKTTTGKVNGALTFNGTSDYVDLGSNVGSFALSNNFTIAAWVNPALDSSDDAIYGNTWNGYGYILRMTSVNKARFMLSRSSNNYNGIDSSVLSSGWHYIVGTWNGTSPKISIDGADNSQTTVTNGTVSSITTNNNTAMGLGGTSDSHYFKGPIDEVRVSNSVRSADWINFEYHNIADSGNDLTYANQETKINTYVITASSGANGTITPSGAVSVNSGANQTFIITPNYGYHILDITADGSSVGTPSTYTFNSVTANHTISATFEATVISGGYVYTGFTSGSIWSQQDWSGGPGQSDFSDSAKYYQDDGNISNNGIPSGLRLANIGNSYVFFGSLESSTFDTGTNLTSYTTLTWQPTSQNPATSIKFQIAANNDNLTWDYLGPDGTDQTYYTVPGATINNLNNNRYIRYKVFLSTADASQTPVLTSVNINYVSGCSSPGQVMFPGLQYSRGYQATISMSGYQTQTISSITVDGYNVLQVLLSH